MNEFFDRIYVINLFDKIDRWNKVSKQFKSRKIHAERFIAIDGRCKDQPIEACKAKLKTFEMIYNVKLPFTKNYKEMIPASSLTIGTILILRNMVKNKYKHILICEDDIELGDNFEKNFLQGIKEINKTKHKDKWDILYLGCGNECGNNGISYDKSKHNNHLSTLSRFYGDMYVHNKDDLRKVCTPECNQITKHISIPNNAGGGWCYAYSLKGAKKMLKLIGDNASEHIDQIYQKTGRMSVLSFDPPIVWHEGGAIRTDSDIPWEW